MAEEFFKKGLSLFDEGKYEEAIAALKKAIANGQEIGWSYFNISKAYYELAEKAKKAGESPQKCYGLIQDSQDAALEARKKIGDNIWIFLQYAKIYAWRGNKETAREYIIKAIQLNPGKNTWVDTEIARIYDKLGDVEKVKAYCKMALKADKNNKDAMSLLKEAAENFHEKGKELLDKGKYEEAIAAFEKAIKNGQEVGWSYFNIGKICLNLADEEQRNAENYQEFLLKAEEATKEAEKILGSNNVWVLLQYANIFARQGDRKAAEAYIDRIPELGKTKDTWVLSSLADVYDKLGEFETANEYSKRALEIDKNNKDAISLLEGAGDFYKKAWSLFVQRKYRESIRASEEAIKRGQNVGWAHFNLSKAQLCLADEAQKNGGEFEKLLKTALDNAYIAKAKVGEDNACIWLQIAKVYAWMGKRDEANHCIEKVHKFDRGDKSWIYSGLALIYDRFNDTETAKEYCEKALQIYEGNREAKILLKQMGKK